ncbi:MAG: acyl--CoA ligase [Archangium sp.]|nr:acyl--CoA ligase [Archangium sp.]
MAWRTEGEAIRSSNGDRRTYAELHARVIELSSALARAGAREGASVVVSISSPLAFVEWALAVWHTGAALVPVDARGGPRAVASAVERLQPAVVVQQPPSAERTSSAVGSPLPAASAQERLVVAAGRMHSAATPPQPGASAQIATQSSTERAHASIDSPRPATSAHAATHRSFEGTPSTEVVHGASVAARASADPLDPRVGLVLFTSGSSGPPKAVLLSRDGLAANVEAILSYLPVAAAPRTAVVLPLVYSYALVGQVLVTLRAGGTLLLLGDVPFPATQLEQMVAGGAQGLSTVAASLRRLSAAVRDGAPAPALRYVASAGAPLDASTVAQVREAFPGATVLNQYGLTEASPRVTAISDASEAFARGSVGRALPGLEAWTIDEQGRRLSAGQPGELVVRGPSVMLGYHRDPTGTARVLSADGALRTGDSATIDERGFVTVHGRLDGVVKVAGERVGLEEISSLLRQVPGVRDVQVVALPDAELDGRLVAIIESGPECIATVRAWARDHLPPQKRPARVVAVAELPRTANGKPDLVALKNLAAAR